MFYKKKKMKRNGFDTFTLLLFIVNTVMTIIDGNYIAALGWGCAVLTMGRIVINNITNDEKI